jgi:hypothetical protein
LAAPTTARAYARTIERLWSELLERPIVFSPRDWALIRDWYDRRIPLQIVREAVESAAEGARKGRRKLPRNLRYIAPLVEEGCAAVREGRAAGRANEVDAAAPDPPEETCVDWAERARREPEGTPLRALLEELQRRLRAGGERAALERLLDARLPESAPRDLVAATQRKVERELAPYRERMSVTVLESTRRRALAARLRAALGLPRGH